MPSRERIWHAPQEPPPVEPLEVFGLDVLMQNPALMQKPPAVIPRLLYRQRVTLFAAREKLGKSTLAAAAIVALSKGGLFLGERVVREPVLLLTEEHLGDPARRLVEMGADPEWVTIGMLPHAGSIEVRVAQIAEAVRRSDFTAVVIDTLSVLMRGMKSHNDSAEVGNLMGPLVEIAHEEGVSLLLLHHANKSDGSYRGSTELAARVDVVAEMSAGSSPSKRRMIVVGRYGVDDFELAYDGRTYALASATELPVEMRVQEFVIQHAGCLISEITEGVTGNDTMIRRAIETLVRVGKVEQRPERRGRRETHTYWPRGFVPGSTAREVGVNDANSTNTALSRDPETARVNGLRPVGADWSADSPADGGGAGESVGADCGRLGPVAGRDRAGIPATPIGPSQPDVSLAGPVASGRPGAGDTSTSPRAGAGEGGEQPKW